MMVLGSERVCANPWLASLLWLGLAHSCWAAEEPKSPRGKAEKSQSEPASQVSFRLPKHFSAIVTDEQRAEIQKVQAGYHEKISELRKKLEELEAAQLKELEGLLTPAQRKTLEEMRTAPSKSDKSESKP